MGRWRLNKALMGASKAMQDGAGIAGNIVGKAADVSGNTIKHAAETGSELRNVAIDEASAISRLGSKKIIKGVSSIKRKTTHRNANVTPNLQGRAPSDNEQIKTTNMDAPDTFGGQASPPPAARGSMPSSMPLGGGQASPPPAARGSMPSSMPLGGGQASPPPAARGSMPSSMPLGGGQASPPPAARGSMPSSMPLGGGQASPPPAARGSMPSSMPLGGGQASPPPAARGSMPSSMPLGGGQASPPATVQSMDIQQQKHRDESSKIDRQTLFTEGMLRLTSENLILYDVDGHREIRRTPIDIIASCSRGLRKNSLVIKRMTNIESNFQKHLDKKRRELSKLPGQISRLKYQTGAAAGAHVALSMTSMDSKGNINGANMAGATVAGVTAVASGAYALKKSHDLKVLPSYIEHLELDIPTVVKTKRKEADTEKESFHLPNNYTQEQASHEYSVWEYLINRCMASRNLDITTTPPNAVVLVDGVVQGCTPLVVDLPLTDKAALGRKMHRQRAFGGIRVRNSVNICKQERIRVS